MSDLSESRPEYDRGSMGSPGQRKKQKTSGKYRNKPSIKYQKITEENFIQSPKKEFKICKGRSH